MLAALNLGELGYQLGLAVDEVQDGSFLSFQAQAATPLAIGRDAVISHETTDRRRHNLSVGFLFFLFRNWVRCKPVGPRRGEGAVASESLLFLQYGTRIPGLGSLAGWLLGLMAMRWPGFRGRIWSWSASHQADRGADHEDVDEGASLCFGKEGAQDQRLV